MNEITESEEKREKRKELRISIIMLLACITFFIIGIVLIFIGVEIYYTLIFTAIGLLLICLLVERHGN